MIDEARLRRVALFDGLAPTALGTIAARASTRRYTAGEILFAAGERATGIYIVLEGRVRAVRELRGRRHVVHEETAGGTLGEVPLFESGGYPATAMAAEPTECLVVGRDVLAAAMREDPELALRLLGRLAARVRTLVERLDRSTAHSVPQRLAAHLLDRLQRTGGSRISLGGTQQAVAEELGTVREVVVRALRALVRDGVLRAAGGGRYEVLDEQGLRERAAGG